jgi:PAS domain S-box-containing protein
MTISGQKEAGDTLGKDDEKFRLAFNKANVGMCLVDLKGNIFRTNEKMSLIFGYEQRDLESMTVNDLTVPEDIALSLQFMDQAIAGDEEQKVFEKHYRHKNGRIIHAQVSSSLVRDAHGQALYFISQVEDITERKRQEAELKQARDAAELANQALQEANAELARHRDQLAQLVLSRTQALAIARDEAESANAVKTRFMANVSHEMRTPLQGILGFSEIGLRRAANLTPALAERYFRNIGECGQRMHALVESLLTLTEQAWVEHAGVAGGQLQDIDLNAFVMETTQLLGLRAETLQQQLLLDMQTAVTSFPGDAIRLRQIFENLIGNALRYSPPASTVTLRVRDSSLRSTQGDESVPAIAFEVIDQGCGIPENEIKAIFEPFYQSTRTACNGGGTGLGLPLSRNIVQRHQGSISLVNRPEGGVMCTVTLPVARTAPG